MAGAVTDAEALEELEGLARERSTHAPPSPPPPPPPSSSQPQSSLFAADPDLALWMLDDERDEPDLDDDEPDGGLFVRLGALHSRPSTSAFSLSRKYCGLADSHASVQPLMEVFRALVAMTGSCWSEAGHGGSFWARAAGGGTQSHKPSTTLPSSRIAGLVHGVCMCRRAHPLPP